jgi:putative transposase
MATQRFPMLLQRWRCSAGQHEHLSGSRNQHTHRIHVGCAGTVDQELLLRDEYLVAENRTLKARLDGRLLLSDAERATLGEIGHRLGRKALAEVANAARPDTILGWYRRLVARKFDGSRARRSPGRPRIDAVIEQLIVRMAKDNPGWGYDRIVGALANLGHEVSDQTVGNVLKRHGLLPAPERKKTTTWAQFIRSHLAVLAGTDFFSVELFTHRGLVTCYVLFFIHLASRKVEVAGITAHPNERWMQQMARKVTMEGWGFLGACRCCTIGTRSTPSRFERSSRRLGSSPLRYRRAARI